MKSHRRASNAEVRQRTDVTYIVHLVRVGVRVRGCTQPKTVGRVYSDRRLTHMAGRVRQPAIAIHTAGRVYSIVLIFLSTQKCERSVRHVFTE